MSLKIDYTLTTSILDSGDITQRIDSNFQGKVENVLHVLYRMQDEQLKNALISLGWTPPKNGTP